ncbi:ABC transporter permease [Xanthovirga aplysinae]|uniref:ABC transporter permease n=1 Tax=Xanthovirga aplysinae TaxID=2529853 RepID=UPI0012BC00B6|nr:ABC transporter permease [Xanthovirga aplysinae]MTI31751.1 ABC transporter permease [Xanthovirga aplysinae]
MFKNYLIIALRNLIKNKFYASINVIGLAVGLSACLLIAFWVKDELSYDRHYSKIDRLYRLTVDYGLNKPVINLAYSPGPLAETFKEFFPEVEEVVRIRITWTKVLSHKLNSLKIDKVTYADPSLFKVFSIPLIQGDPNTALVEPNSIVLDESTAKRLFGDKDPLNKMVVLDNNQNYKVTGVFQNIPENSHLKVNVFCSIEKILEEPWTQEWTSHSLYTYLLLKEQTDPKFLEAKFPEVIKTYASKDIYEATGSNWEEMKKNNLTLDWHLQPVKNIHLYSNLEGEAEHNGNITYVYAFSFIAILILTVACINYINLATARSTNRGKEIGVRKVVGAQRPQLIRQFLSESLILSFCATLLAIGLMELFLPTFNQVSGKSISVQYWGNWQLLSGLLACPLLLATLSGFYPAFFLSTFQPVTVLRGKLTSEPNGAKFQSLLVIIQFAISIFLIVGTLVLYQQIHFIHKKDIGFVKDHLLIVEGTYVLGERAEPLKQELLNFPEFKSGTFTGYLPVEFASRWGSVLEGNGEGNRVDCTIWLVDFDYINTLGMKLKEGRYFSTDYPSDSSAVVVNESAIKMLGYNEPIGQTIRLYGKEYPIIGVVKDFNYTSMKNRIKPAALFLENNTDNLTFRIDGKRTKEAMTLLEHHWKKIAPDQPLTYSFMDERFDQMYKEEQKTAKVLSIFSGLAIFIACLGLFALAAFTAEQRKKEIGVRKVLGSSVTSIVLLLSKDFAKLIFIAFLIASPIAWWVMNDWLEGFAYRTSIGVGVFLVAAGLSFLVAWITMSYHAIKAATDDPVNSIRYE